MTDVTDMDLLRDHVQQHSEAAFAELVRRHINLVYSVALRFTGQPGDAQDITQAVFIILARKAASLRETVVLTGWLYETTRFTAARHLRTQARRLAREQEAYMQSDLNAPDTHGVWLQLAPHLETAMARLSEPDRTVLALRYYENLTGAEAARQLGIREEAAHKRTARALEKLRNIFAKRGLHSTAATLAAAISTHSIQAAPPALAHAISAAALTKGALASASTLTLVKGALKAMAWSQIKTPVIVAAVVLAAAAVIGVAEHKRAPAREASPVVHEMDFALQADGTALARLNIMAVNTSQEAWGTNEGGSLFSGIDITRFTDENGQAITYQRGPGGPGNPFKYTYILNHPVPPGGTCALKMEGTVDASGTGLVKPAGEPEVFEYHLNQQMGNQSTIHRVDVYRLPPGAVLLDKLPADLMTSTNGGQVALRLDLMLAPPGKTEVRFRYRLAEAAK